MPEQQSQRGQVITTATFENPFSTEIYPFGAGGLNLKDAIDAIPVGQFSRSTNMIHSQDRAVTGRPGLTSLATAGTEHHSVRRLSDPQAGTYTRIWGIDQKLYRGQSGALTQIDAGYSGDPLYLLPHRPPLSGDPWMFVGDRSRMRKVRADGLDLPIGLPAPGAAPTVALGTFQKTLLAAFDKNAANGGVDDFTGGQYWTPNAGYDYSDTPIATGVPLTYTDSGRFTTVPGAAVEQAGRGYYSYWGLPKVLDMSATGAKVTTDDDLINLIIKWSHPELTAETRIYFVCSPGFDPTVLPGTREGINEDFYVKAFRPSDLADFIHANQIAIDAAEVARVAQLREDALANASEAGGYSSVREARVVRTDARFMATRDPFRGRTTTAGAGTMAFTNLGTLGVPLRRGEWKRIGITAGCDWNTITGIVIYLQATEATHGPIEVTLIDMYLHGGSGPDTTEPGAQSYDIRYTHYDPRTGAEGNPSPIMAEANYIDTMRRDLVTTPVAYGDSAVRQRFYRRGGTLIDDWYFLGGNAADGGAYTDSLSDDAIVAAGTLHLDHYQPVPTVDDDGNTVLAQPCPVLFGPAQGMLFALGDPRRPGHLYYCLPDAPDHWSATGNVEVCAPSEELMAGGMYGAQPFCFSRERLYVIYPNLSGDTSVQATTTACSRGVVGRHAFCVTLGGIFGVAEDGIFATGGQAEEVISQPIEKIFRGETWNGYSPVNFAFPNAIRLTPFNDLLYFQYQGTDGNRYVVVYSLIYKFWTMYDFAVDTAYIQPDDDTPIATLLVGGLSTGKSYTHTGFSDDGTAITGTLRTGCWDLGRPREDKLLGDQILDADLQSITGITFRNRLNNETVVNGVQGLETSSGRKRFILDSFGTEPQRARNISTEIIWSSASARPTFHFLGLSVIPEPDVTINRVTQWDDLNHPDEAYVTGITLDCDTGGEDFVVHVERDWEGLTTIIDTITVTCDGRHKRKFSWAALPANKVRLRPDNECLSWILYKADWIWVPEPPRISKWDIHFEADGDQYVTGLDLYCQTEGLEKRIQIYIDNVQILNTHGGLNLNYWPVTTNGRQWVHLTLPSPFPGLRGHVFHFIAIDDNAGLLYKHRWMVEAEPGEQANWNQNFTNYGSRADKWLKAVVFECDTFGQGKQVQVEVDGTLVETLSVNAYGRKVVQIALAQQSLGRIWRMYPVDGNPGRLYSVQPVFDEEPFCLDRWETQELDFDHPGFHLPVEGQITLKSTEPVTLRVTQYVNQTGTVLTEDYEIRSTEGIKDKVYVPFKARKGVLTKLLFTSEVPFYLYEEESSLTIWPWGAETPIIWHGFGNEGADRTRGMTISSLAAARSGGGT
jgi:hypothetical protein